MSNKTTEKYVTWYLSRPKWQRCALKSTGVIFVFCTSPVWLPAMLAVWGVLTLIIAVAEFIENA